MTGTYTGEILGAASELNLIETGEGFLKGGLERGASTYVSTGYRLGNVVVLNLLATPAGHQTYVGSVSGNFNTLVFPSPIGVLNRKLQ